MLKEFTLKTDKEGLYNITAKVAEAVKASGVKDGVVIIYCPHTTGGITINENCDPDVVTDLLLGLAKAFPYRAEFRHSEGNSAAHLKSSCVGASQTIIIAEGNSYSALGRGFIFANLTVRDNANILLKSWRIKADE